MFDTRHSSAPRGDDSGAILGDGAMFDKLKLFHHISIFLK